MDKLKNSMMIERNQLRLEAGPIARRLPGVASIVISMEYYKKIAARSFMQRTVRFLPATPAYFHLDCMKTDCVHGGFDLESAIFNMVRNHEATGMGGLSCRGDDAAGHTRIDYRIAIQYFDAIP